MPGCRQYVAWIQDFGLVLGAQSIAHAPFVNPFGLVTSNGLLLGIGN